MNLANLFINISTKVDSSGVDTAANNVRGSMKRMSSALNSVRFSGLVSRITALRYSLNATVWAARQVIGTIHGIAMAAAEKQEVEISFEVMTGGAEKGLALLSDVHELALRMPFTIVEMERAARTMIAVGLSPERVTPTLEMLAEIAAASEKVGLHQVADMYGQIQAAGRLTGITLRRFTQAGIPILKLISELPEFERRGITAGDVRDMLGTGAITAGIVERAIRKATEAGGQFHGMTERLMATARGMTSRIKDELTLFKRDFGTEFSAQYVKALGMIRTGMRRLLPWFRRFFGQVIRHLANIANEAFWHIRRMIVHVRDALVGLGLNLENFGLALVRFFGLIQAYKYITKIGVLHIAFWKGLAAGLTAAAAGIATFYKALAAGKFKVAFAGLITGLKGLWVALKPLMMGLLLVALVLLFDELRMIYQYGDDVDTVFKRMGVNIERLQENLHAAVKGFRGLMGVIKNFLMFDIDGLKHNWSVLREEWGKLWHGLGQDVQKQLTRGLGTFATFMLSKKILLGAGFALGPAIGVAAGVAAGGLGLAYVIDKISKGTGSMLHKDDPYYDSRPGTDGLGPELKRFKPDSIKQRTTYTDIAPGTTGFDPVMLPEETDPIDVPEEKGKETSAILNLRINSLIVYPDGKAIAQGATLMRST